MTMHQVAPKVEPGRWQEPAAQGSIQSMRRLMIPKRGCRFAVDGTDSET
jgi:hypothetical protein